MATPEAFFDKEVKWFRDWVDARLKWLDANLPGVCASVNETPRDGGAGADAGGAPRAGGAGPRSGGLLEARRDGRPAGPGHLAGDEHTAR